MPHELWVVDKENKQEHMPRVSLHFLGFILFYLFLRINP